jgi:2-keto-4-pentenoate hydratase/2-oxohepta-3-ene-1,7-dioic acid hydratase in catechol pathway
MKLARFDVGRGPQLGLVKDAKIIDLATTGLPYRTMLEIVATGQEGLARIRQATEALVGRYALDQVRLLPPIERPGKYLAIGMNYQKHVEEAARLGVKPSAAQYWFNKQTSCIAGPFDAVVPGVTEKLDYEVELCVVIGPAAKGVTEAEAPSYIFGYMVANDVSARDWQFHSPTFTIGKSFDTHGPVGPWIVTADEISDPHRLDLSCSVNGEIRQQSNTSQMIHNIYAQIAYLSTAFTLEPGDLIATGTPDGVGVSKSPPVFLKPGDVVRCEIQDIGFIENRVAAPDGATVVHLAERASLQVGRT